MQWEHIRNNNTTKFKFTTKYIKNKTGNNIETETKEIKFDTESTFEEPSHTPLNFPKKSKL